MRPLSRLDSSRALRVQIGLEMTFHLRLVRSKLDSTSERDRRKSLPFGFHNSLEKDQFMDNELSVVLTRTGDVFCQQCKDYYSFYSLYELSVFV